MNDPINFADSYLRKVKQAMDTLDLAALAEVIHLMGDVWQKGSTVFLAGNGGSASTASHMANDLGKTVLGIPADQEKKGFRALALTDNVSLLTAWANDEGYENIFAGQLCSLARAGDLLIVLSVSGNSENLIKAAGQAKQMGMKVIGFLGQDGGRLRKMVDLAVILEGTSCGPVEDSHLMLSHLITAYFQQLT